MTLRRLWGIVLPLVIVAVGTAVLVAEINRTWPELFSVRPYGEASNAKADDVPVVTVDGDAGHSALAVLDRIEIVGEHRDGYDRDLFDYPIELDGNGCNTRDVVLTRDSTSPAQVDAYGCHVVAGDWYSVYDNLTWTDPAELEIDHVVALAEAWDSGAWAWTPERRRAFANDVDDLRMLRAVTGEVNEAKSADDPADWLPAHKPFLCDYLGDWTAIKALWSLSMDAAEHQRVHHIVTEQCPDLTVTLRQVRS